MQTVKVRAVWYAPLQCWIVKHPDWASNPATRRPHDGAVMALWFVLNKQVRK